MQTLDACVVGDLAYDFAPRNPIYRPLSAVGKIAEDTVRL